MKAALLVWALLATYAAAQYRRAALRARLGWIESIALARAANAGWGAANDLLIAIGEAPQEPIIDAHAIRKDLAN